MLCVTLTSPTDTHAADTVYHGRAVTIATFGVYLDTGVGGRLLVADVIGDGGGILFVVKTSRPPGAAGLGREPGRIIYQDIRIEEMD
jgi:hypothetical protein